MKNWWALIFALVGAALLAIIATTPPAPLPSTAPPDQFAAERAMADVRRIAQAPHPTGSADNARVRAMLIARMTALGLAPTTTLAAMDAYGAKTLRRWRGGAGPVPPVINIIGVLPGRDRSAPAVMLMAHYDSVWGSPGAADDGAGVAAILEVVRAVKTTGMPRRDLIVLLTDGEELGLQGAKAFFDHDPRRMRVGVVVNLEARGGGGRASMFETGADNGAMMRLMAASVRRPVATSTSVFIYRYLPNSTDLTPAKKQGVPGFNFAFIGRPGLYHSPLATPDALDRGSLQDMGGQALDLVRSLLAVPALPGRAADITFFDAFGLGLILYPAVFGWMILAVAAGAYVIAAGRQIDGQEVVQGAGMTIALIVVAGLLLYSGNLVSGADGPVNYYDRLAAIPRLQVQALLIVVATFALMVSVGWHTTSVLAGTAVPLLLLGGVMQALAPTAAYLVTVPLLLGGIGLAARRWSGEIGRLTCVIAAMLGGGHMIAMGFLLIQSVGPDMPYVAALPLAVTAVLVWPLMPIIDRWWLRLAALSLLIAATGIALWIRLDAVAPSVATYSEFR